MRKKKGSVTIEACLVSFVFLTTILLALGILLSTISDLNMLTYAFHENTHGVNQNLLWKFYKLDHRNEIGNKEETTVYYHYRWLPSSEQKKWILPVQNSGFVHGDELYLKTQTVYITLYGIRYHDRECFYLRKSCVPIDREKAKDKGYTPCKRCLKRGETSIEK